MKQKIFNYTAVFKKEPEGGYTVIVPSLQGCISYGKDLEEANRMIVEAIELYIESLKEHNEDIPSEKETFYKQVSITSNA